MSILPKVLIIDDEPVIRELLETLLAGEGLELLFAENGETGLKLAQEFQPDAILLDVMMPVMDGYETCRQIRATPGLSEVPIIILSALADREARLSGLRAGADDFLTKPFDAVEMKVRVKNIMRLNRYRNLVAERSRFYWVVENDEKGISSSIKGRDPICQPARTGLFSSTADLYRHQLYQSSRALLPIPLFG